MTRLYAGNLSFHTTEAALQDAFVACGDVSEVKIVLDRETGRSRGFGFVTMSNGVRARALRCRASTGTCSTVARFA